MEIFLRISLGSCFSKLTWAEFANANDLSDSSPECLNNSLSDFPFLKILLPFLIPLLNFTWSTNDK